MLNKNCTEPCLVRYIEAIYIYTDKNHHSIRFEIPERVLLTGAISICKRFSKASHRCKAKMCDLSLLAIFKVWVFTLWHIILVLYSKRTSSTTAPTDNKIYLQASKSQRYWERSGIFNFVSVCFKLDRLYQGKPGHAAELIRQFLKGVITWDESIVSGMLRHGSPPNLHNLAKWDLKRIALVSRHETWQTVLARWP